MSENRRQFPRFTFDKPVQYQPNEGADSRGALATDISLGGIKITVNEFMALGSVLEMGIYVAELGQQVPMKGKVVWVRENILSERFDVGLEFIKDEHTASFIEAIIKKRQR